MPLGSACGRCYSRVLKDIPNCVHKQPQVTLFKLKPCADAINEDIGGEVTTYIQASGLLSSPFAGGSSLPHHARKLGMELDVQAMDPITTSANVDVATRTGGLTPRMSQFDKTLGPAAYVPPVSNGIQLPSTRVEEGSSEPARQQSNSLTGLHHSSEMPQPSASTCGQITGGVSTGNTPKDDNGFGSFMQTPPLPQVSVGSAKPKLGVATVYENPSGHFVGLSGALGSRCGTPRSDFDALTMDLSGTAALRHQKGMPTLSQAVEPGPYHKANARLRVQLPHYRARVTVRVRWDHVLMTLLTFCTFFGYIGIRVWYLVSGKSVEFRTQNISLKYSWVVLAAEVVSGLLLFYSNQLFWKQELVYTIMEDEEVQQMTEVRYTVCCCSTFQSISSSSTDSTCTVVRRATKRLEGALEKYLSVQQLAYFLLEVDIRVRNDDSAGLAVLDLYQHLLRSFNAQLLCRGPTNRAELKPPFGWYTIPRTLEGAKTRVHSYPRTFEFHPLPRCLDLQAYLHVQWLRFQHVSAYSLRKTSGNTKDKSLPRNV